MWFKLSSQYSIGKELKYKYQKFLTFSIWNCELTVMWPKEWFKFDSQPLKHKKSNDFKIKHVIILKFYSRVTILLLWSFSIKTCMWELWACKIARFIISIFRDSHFRIFFCFDVTITNNHKIYYREDIDACSQRSKPCE